MAELSLTDVIIVGAGPAGAAAAYFLSEAGLKVVVLEKAPLPRYKACGGGLSAQMLEKYFPFSFRPVFEVQAKSISYALSSHFVTVPVPQSSMRLVMRDRFDAFILSHASAEVRSDALVTRVQETETGVKVETADGRLYGAQIGRASCRERV
jgi:flavin-dependent dehydrogenase